MIINRSLLVIRCMEMVQFLVKPFGIMFDVLNDSNGPV